LLLLVYENSSTKLTIKIKYMNNWKKFWLNPWFGFMVIAAFVSVISFFQINSAWADEHNFNGKWLVIGIVFALAAVGCLYKAKTTSKD